MMPQYKVRRFSKTFLEVQVASGIPHVDKLAQELEDMRNVLFGRVEVDYDSDYLGLMEVSTAYFCRGQEIDELIHKAERDGTVVRGSALYKFRTGELRSFLELTKMAANLGSRRLTQEQLLHNMREVT
jgi:hypothetical protein